MLVASLKKMHSIPFICLLLCNTALADGIGQVLAATGTVKTQGGQSLQRGSKVSESDTIVTGAGSNAQIKLSDGTVFSIAENSAMKVSSYKTGPKPTTIVDLQEGTVRTQTGEIGQKNPDGFKVVTPIATVGIRGTDFTSRYQKGTSKDDKGIFEAEVHSGSISIINNMGILFIGQGYPAMGAVVAGLSIPQISNVKIPTPPIAGDGGGAAGHGGGIICFNEN